MPYARNKELILFFALAYGIAWLGWLPLILSRTGMGILPITVPMEFIIIGSFAPTVAALITQWRSEHNLRIFRLGASWQRFLFGIILGFLLIAITFVLLSSLLMTKGSFKAWDWHVFSAYPVAILMATLKGAGPLGEEPGWRGFALPRLQEKLSPLLASLTLGSLWFVWHLPLFLIPSWSSSPIVAFGLIIMGLTFLLSFGFNFSGQSVMVAILMHGTFNASSSFLSGFLGAAEVRERPSPEFIIGLAFVLSATMITVLTRGKLGAK